MSETSLFKQTPKSPNLDKLFLYMRKSLWHNVTANFSGFVKRELESNLGKLEAGHEEYTAIKLLVEFSETGKFLKARAVQDDAYREYCEMNQKLADREEAMAPKIKPKTPHKADDPSKMDIHTTIWRPDDYIPTKARLDSQTKPNGDTFTMENLLHDGNQNGHTGMSNEHASPGNSGRRRTESRSPATHSAASSLALGKQFQNNGFLVPGAENTRGSAQSRLTETPDYVFKASEVAKRFQDVYNNQWKQAYGELSRQQGSEAAVRNLHWIVIECWRLACDIADDQLKELEKTAFGLMTHLDHQGNGPPHPGPTGSGHPGAVAPASQRLLVRYRRQTAALSVPYVQEVCHTKISKSLLLNMATFSKNNFSSESSLTAYIDQCAEVAWMACVQDPPIVLEYIDERAEGSRFNHEQYYVFTTPGTSYEYGVWPVLRSGENRKILAKGIAQGI